MNVISKGGRQLIGIAVVALAMSACGSDNQPSSSQAVATTVVIPSATPTAVPPTIAPTATAIPTATAVPTAEPTATPGSSQLQTTGVTLSDAQATELAVQALALNSKALPVPISNPRITFSPQDIKLAADMQGQAGAKLEVAGTPSVESERVYFKLTSLKLNGIEVPFYRHEVEDAINNMFSQMLAGRHIQSVQLGDGSLTVVPKG